MRTSPPFWPEELARDLADPRSLPCAIERFIDSVRTQGASELSIQTRRSRLRAFALWCAERDVRRPVDVSRALLDRYARWLCHYRKESGEPLAITSRTAQLVAVRGLFRWLAKNREVLYNPASEIELPKLGVHLPKAVLTADEAEEVLAQPDLQNPFGLRDRAILETLYSTGMRRMEIRALRCEDVDASRGLVFIRQGKGRKDRVIPIGERALSWIARYRAEVRPRLSTENDKGTLFLAVSGNPLALCTYTDIAARYVGEAKLEKYGSCHLFRHTMATLMLENGADIRYVQEMLGHEKLSTTQIYTRVSVRKLKEVHAATHPAAKLCPDPPNRPSTF